ncbi:YdeI/OmpD-associated family protein [Rhodobacteraceae bacterium N5(2021)]|uniref:YdeI/OmpD-associated family protein n=1 Tax=Gymnodinialimonas phycosphaerae TaxID=2841589 RepID=A0A975YG69_9RHOB|nr:YdeI/OmpD-associated family protein [Gymnodinialimonas phycosphaerae]MBY4891302.1 YdeI/OmpD-associated family protein [Gymnodinialimonas phycosphaerae]
MEDIDIDGPTALWKWLDANHTRTESVRIVTWKAAHPDKYVSREQVLDALMAYGWIDGRRFTVDTQRTAQMISPRKTQAWSQSYKTRVEDLRREGRMHLAGEAAVAAGKASGLWDFFDDVDKLIVPDDLALALDAALWEALPPAYRRNVLRWIKLAKTPATRQKRIDQATTATRTGQRIPQM